MKDKKKNRKKYIPPKVSLLEKEIARGSWCSWYTGGGCVDGSDPTWLTE